MTLLASLDDERFVIAVERTVEGSLGAETRIVQSEPELSSKTEDADEALERFCEAAEQLSERD